MDSQDLLAFSRIIDKPNIEAGRSREAITWGRIAKITEEHGEATAAWIGVTGQNFRKGVHSDMREVQHELYDVALTALLAVSHCQDFYGNESTDVLADFMRHAERKYKRATEPHG